MGGGGNLVDGVRRWLFQRPSSSSNNNHEQPILNSSSFSSSNPGNSGELIIIEDLDFSGLTLIKVPKRNHLPMDPQKKVPFFYPLSILGDRFIWECMMLSSAPFERICFVSYSSVLLHLIRIKYEFCVSFD